MSLAVQFQPSLRTTPLLSSAQKPIAAPQVAASRFGTSVSMNTTYFAAEPPLFMAPVDVMRQTVTSIGGAFNQIITGLASALGQTPVSHKAALPSSASLGERVFFELASPHATPLFLSRMPSKGSSQLNVVA
jgi:hypothetical protein